MNKHLPWNSLWFFKSCDISVETDVLHFPWKQLHKVKTFAQGKLKAYQEEYKMASSSYDTELRLFGLH